MIPRNMHGWMLAIDEERSYTDLRSGSITSAAAAAAAANSI